MEKIFLKSVVIVEGKHDKIKLESFLDATIITLNGFRIYKDKQKLAAIHAIAKKDGVIILTDSDVAGFKLRGFLKSVIGNANIINIYIPQIKGKEKRKANPSKQGFLGVEGMTIDTLKTLLQDYGVLCDDKPKTNQITKMDFYNDGLIGQDDSKTKRGNLLKLLDLPTYLTTNALLDIINRLINKQEYDDIINKINNKHINTN